MAHVGEKFTFGTVGRIGGFLSRLQVSGAPLYPLFRECPGLRLAHAPRKLASGVRPQTAMAMRFYHLLTAIAIASTPIALCIESM